MRGLSGSNSDIPIPKQTREIHNLVKCSLFEVFGKLHLDHMRQQLREEISTLDRNPFFRFND